MSAWNAAALNRVGLNLQAVFDVDELPESVAAPLRSRFDPDGRFRQLILIGHAGTALWSALKAAGLDSENPIDDFSCVAVEQWLTVQCGDVPHSIIYPGPGEVGLQTLGRLAGWHHDSPLGVGIDETWGTWFAYRVAVLAATDLEPTPPVAGESPCAFCRGRECVAACPAGALSDGRIRLETCIAYRKRSRSPCASACSARLACPVGARHRYCDEQIRHAYTHSMRYIAAA